MSKLGLIRIVLFTLLGATLPHIGVPFDTWGFWAVMLLVVLIQSITQIQVIIDSKERRTHE